MTPQAGTVEDCRSAGLPVEWRGRASEGVVAVLAALPHKAARELRSVLRPLDERYLARAVADLELYRLRVLLF
ncbi:hypothetical protein [Amycolatopsis tucumanensis]|uniref:hypothetical protein n=1 Tax=Amycolatopsis tucumanensis TaxID=401106 RepID=UPI001F4124A8|nr:hypothetical protein [Amycolatopsis tucumanensis]MCF6422503.1 hypothetical protein [Amycolatopsis tucumanensis]